MRYFIAIAHEDIAAYKGTVLVRAADMVDAGEIASRIDPDATTIMTLELFMK